jgi:hypothetical protein
MKKKLQYSIHGELPITSTEDLLSCADELDNAVQSLRGIGSAELTFDIVEDLTPDDK